MALRKQLPEQCYKIEEKCKRRKGRNDTNKASASIRLYRNENGPAIGVTIRSVIEKDGLYLRDLTGDGRLAPYKGWRNTPATRAASLVAELSADGKVGMLPVNSWKMEIYQEDRTKVDENGLFNEEIVEQDKSIFNVEKTYGTTHTLEGMSTRHFILRQNPEPGGLVDWINQLNMMTEGTGHAPPAMVLSNSRNEHGEIVLGMNDAADASAAWPGTLGIVAAIRGSGPELIDGSAECIRREWDAVGMKKGYMYMVDVMTDPRWQRSYGTFGENPGTVCTIMERLIPGIRGSSRGATRDGIAVTIKHFPGGGARENGFNPHYVQGQWNVYQTEDSLCTCHLPAPHTVIEKKASSIMPYYTKPSAAKNRPQYGPGGDVMEMEPIEFALSRSFVRGLLRRQMGFEGYANSDSGISNKMVWGVEELDVPSRIALAVDTRADIISGSLDVFSAREVYERGRNGHYTAQGHSVFQGYRAGDLVLTDEALTRAVTRTLKEKFELGMLDNPYRDPETAKQVVATKKHWEGAYRVHQQSVVLLKNKEGLIPLDREKAAGRKICVGCLGCEVEAAARETDAVRTSFVGRFQAELTEDCREVDFTILFIRLSLGEYFHSTKEYLELDICKNKQARDVDSQGRPTDSFYQEIILLGARRIREIYESLHSRGGKVIPNTNSILAWEVGNVKPCVDTLPAGFDIYTDAVSDITMGRCVPTGRTPITLPRNDNVIRVDRDGVCTSRNGVPGYHKDEYIPEPVKDENGKAYAYRDSEGNYYELDFGLTLE